MPEKNKHHRQIKRSKRRCSVWCGAYQDIAKAARAYNKKAVELFGEYALLNEVEK